MIGAEVATGADWDSACLINLMQKKETTKKIENKNQVKAVTPF